MVFDIFDLFFLIVAAKRSKNDVFRSDARLTAKTKIFRHFSLFCQFFKNSSISNISGKKLTSHSFFSNTFENVRQKKQIMSRAHKKKFY